MRVLEPRLASGWSLMLVATVVTTACGGSSGGEAGSQGSFAAAPASPSSAEAASIDSNESAADLARAEAAEAVHAEMDAAAAAVAVTVEMAPASTPQTTPESVSITPATAASAGLPAASVSTAATEATAVFTETPVILNASRSARAGDVVSLQGRAFGSNPVVWLDATAGAAASQLQILNRSGTGWLAVQIPPAANGALSVRVQNGLVSSAPIKLNAAQAHHLDALQITPGGSMRLFGRNLLLPGFTPAVTINGVPAAIKLSSSHEHMLFLTVPQSLPEAATATITVNNGNGTGPSTLDRTIEIARVGSGDPFGLGVGWAAAFSPFAGRVIDARSDSRLGKKVRCDGATDDSAAIEEALKIASVSGGVVQLPAGTCRLAKSVALKSMTVLQGAGKDRTILRYEADYPLSGGQIDRAGVRNLTLTNAGSARQGPLLHSSTRVFLQNVKFNFGPSHQIFLDKNRNMVVRGSDFVQTSPVGDRGPYYFGGTSGLLFAYNTTQIMAGSANFERVHDSYFYGNRFTRDVSNQWTPGVVHHFTVDWAHRIAAIGNTFNNVNGPITNKQRNDGEAFLTEGGGGARTENLGAVSSATATTLTDSGNSLNVDPFKTGAIPYNYGVAIVGGRGMGQTRRVVAYAGKTLTVDSAWSVVPDSTSRYAVMVWGLEKSLVKNNTFTDSPRGIWLYQTAIRDVELVGNTFTENGGIYLRSYQNVASRMFTPIYNVKIARNRVSNTGRRWVSSIVSIFVNSDGKDFGTGSLGIDIQDNQVIANVPNIVDTMQDYAAKEGFMSQMRVEVQNYQPAPGTPRLYGTLFQRNSCSHCAVGFRLGTGSNGTAILRSQLQDATELWVNERITTNEELATDTLVR